ncbi:tyrosine-type recombinase/integrase [Formosa sp. A9]|uniref:tyrosine-type recombinase/integrase n=1 Tax=Formosa sp. A9 TaxID=3442641 RepID=UPI003EBC19A2
MSLPTVTILPKYHRKKHQLFIEFSYDTALIKRVRMLKGALWSASHTSWYVPYDEDALAHIKSVFDGYATVNDSAVDYSLIGKTKHIKRARTIIDAHRIVLQGYRDYLRGKRYSDSTVSSYLALMADLIEFHDGKPLEAINNRTVEAFVEQIMVPKHYAISTHRQFISAIKHFTTFYTDTEIDDLKLYMPKKDKLLPTVLSQAEIIDLIRCTENLKHRTILSLIYSCGLRIGEVVNLRTNAIDIDRRQVIVKQGKGRKDRYVILAESFLPMLQNYVLTYQPNQYLFEGQNNTQYSQESIRAFLKRSCQKAKITKRITPHTLRHSYATHLLEQGIDIRYIQELLGHCKPETTMIYTHVSKKDLLNIKSPLDVAIKGLSTPNAGQQGLLSQHI